MAATRKPQNDVTTAREYLRVSLDKSGRAKSLDEQHEENARTAEAQGWTVGTPYRDKPVSASRYTSKAREGYDTLVRELEDGKFAADVLMLWESSRGSRRVGEWVLLCDLLAERKVKVYVTTHGRVYDASNPRDRRSLLEDAVDSEYESGKLSMRLKRTMASNAAAGKAHGRVPFGYRRTYDPGSGRPTGQEPDPHEAPVVRELFDRLQRGHSLSGIAADFKTRGVVRRSGSAFSPEHLRSLAMTHAYAAIRIYDPHRHDKPDRRLTEHAQEFPADWKPLVDKATFYGVRRILSDPARVTTKPGKGKHLLSMIGRCGVCGGKLAARFAASSKRPRPGGEYTCHDKSCVKISKPDLDDYAERVILAYLSRPDNVERLTAPEEGEVLAAVADEVAEIRAELDDLADNVASGALSATLAARAEPGIRKRLDEAESRQEELSTPSVLRGLITPGKNVQRSWKAAEMSTRREVARLLLTPEVLGELRVMRSPTRGRVSVPAAERVEWRREDGN